MTKPQFTVPLPKAALSVEEAAAVLGLGRTFIYQLIREQALETIKTGRRRLVPVTSIHAFLARTGEL